MSTERLFFPYAWHVKDSEIHVYGFEPDRSIALVRLQEFTPYVYVKLPSHVNWTPSTLHRLLTVLKKSQAKIFKTSLTYKRPLYYAHLHYEDDQPRYDTLPYLFVAFETEADRRHFSFSLRKEITVMGIGSIKLEIYEHNATPVLQLTCLRGISTADWFRVRNVQHASEPISRLKQEYVVNWKCATPLSDSCTIPDLPRPLIMSYDIECCFHDPNTFSDGSHVNDVVFQISCVFGYQSEPQSQWERYLLTLGNPDPEILEGVRVLTYKKEFQLLMGFNDLVIEKNPQILIGYNIFKFDIPFMYKRAVEQRVHDDFVRHGCTRERCKLETIRWSSSAYSTQEMNFMDLQGRMTIDLLTLIQRDFNLENYKLDTVAEKFLGTGKDPLNHLDIFACYKVGLKETAEQGVSRALGLVGKYCVKDSVLVLELFEKFQYWYSLTEMAKICQVPHAHLFLYGQQLKVFSQVYKYCYQNNIVCESGRFKASEEDICTGAYVFTPEPGLYDNVVSFDFCLTGDTLVSMANGTSRRIDSLVRDEQVLGFKHSGLQPFSTVNGLQVKGLRDTIRLTFQGGRTLVCTPDHKLMDYDGNWIRADETQRTRIPIRCGLQFPEDKICPLEKDWVLYIGNAQWKMCEMRDRVLALCRMFGYVYAFRQVDYVTFETHIDALSFMTDVTKVIGKPVNLKSECTVPLPGEIQTVLRQLDSDHLFLYEDHCPTSVIREFLAGCFGVLLTPSRQSRFANHQDRLNPLLERFGYTHLFDCVNPNRNKKFMQYVGVRYNVKCLLPPNVHLQQHANSIPCWTEKVTRIDENGLQPVFDIEVAEVHNFLANGIVVSNCSLYPSIIISHNIDFTTLVDPEDPNGVSRIGSERLTHIAWEEHINCACPSATQTKDKEFRCKTYSYFWLKEPIGVLPTIIRNLLDARKAVRKQMKTLDQNSLLYDILNKRQLAYKVSSNSMYGALSTRKGYLPFMPAGMCVTAIGRRSIEHVSQIIQSEHQGKIVYGDSVTGETPILVRDPKSGDIFVRTIESLGREWVDYPTFRMFDLWNLRLEKQYSLSDLEVWSDMGWTRIRKVIRHKTQKRLYTVGSARGVVCVTEDHSLLTAEKKKIRPADVRIGQKLLYSFPKNLNVADASDYDPTAYRQGVFCQTRVPEHILNGSRQTIEHFIRGFINEQFYPKYIFRSPALAQDFYILLSRLGKSVRIRVKPGSIVVYELLLDDPRPGDDRVTLLHEHTSGTHLSTFVYDLETECGRFQAGVGQMIVKNTDSNYVMFPHLTDLQAIWDHSMHVSEEVSKKFPEPMRLEFEEHIYARYLILSKKRYLYFSCTPDGQISKKIENKGVLLKRRDNSKVVRDIYENLIRMVLEKCPEIDVVSQFVQNVERLYTRLPSAEDFQMSKSVKGIQDFEVAYRDARTIKYGDYVVPRLKEQPEERAKQLAEKNVQTEVAFYQSHLPGAVQLALRMRARGQHIESGSRLSYVVTRRAEHKAGVAEKMEEIEYFKMHYSKEMIDILHYLHLLINPVEEVLTVMYGAEYHHFVKDMYKYHIKYDAVVDQLFKFFHPIEFSDLTKQ